MLVHKNPEEVHPAKDRAGKRNDGKDKPQNIVGSLRALDDGGDTNDEFDDPVNAGNEKKDELNKPRKTVECFHGGSFRGIE